MKAGSPFDHRPDHDLGSALREVLTPDGHRPFVHRVMARCQALGDGVVATSWWEVLGGWAAPGFAAAMVVAFAAVLGARNAGSVSAPSVTLDDALVLTVDTTEQTSLLLSPNPPDADVVLASLFER